LGSLTTPSLKKQQSSYQDGNNEKGISWADLYGRGCLAGGMCMG
jgi:hypothetical protein